MIVTFLTIILIQAGPEPAWQMERTAHFEINYQERSRDLADSIRPRLEPELERISRFIGAEPPMKIYLVIAPDAKTFSEFQGGGVPRWVSGMAYPGRSLIVVRPLLGAEIRHSTFASVVSHEITHIVLHHRLGSQTPPRWLDEGLAVYMGREPFLARSERLLPIAMTGRGLDFSSLEDGFPSDRDRSSTAYAQSGDFVKFLISNQGENNFREFLNLLAAGEPPELAAGLAFNSSLGELESEWLKSVRRTYGLFALLSGGGFLWFFISLLFILAYLKKRRGLKELRQARALEEQGWQGHAGLESEGFEDDDEDEDPPDRWLH